MNKRKILLFIWITILITIPLMYTSGSVNDEILFLLNCFGIGCLLMTAKSSILSLVGIFIYYPLLSVRNQVIYGKSYGVLEDSVNKGIALNYSQILFSVLLAISVIIIFICLTNFLDKEQKFQKSVKLNLTRETEVVLCGIAVLGSIITFPTIPFVYSSTSRFVSLLPGNAWNHLVISVLCLIFLNKSKSLISIITLIICTFWFISHYERVDILGLYLGMLFLNYSSKIFNISLKKKIIALVSFVFIVFMMVYLGEKRSGVTDITLGYMISKVLVQNTASDIMYVFNIAINVVSYTGFLYGRTFSHYITDAIPLFNGEGVPELLTQYFYSPGGEYILIEPYINFGYIGIVAFFVIVLVLLNKLLNKPSFPRYFYYFFFLCTIPRICWYGISFIETASLIFIPLLILLIKYFSSNTFKVEIN